MISMNRPKMESRSYEFPLHCQLLKWALQCSGKGHTVLPVDKAGAVLWV